MSGLLFDLVLNLNFHAHLVDIEPLELMPLYLGIKIRSPLFDRFIGKYGVEPRCREGRLGEVLRAHSALTLERMVCQGQPEAGMAIAA